MERIDTGFRDHSIGLRLTLHVIFKFSNWTSKFNDLVCYVDFANIQDRELNGEFNESI